MDTSSWSNKFCLLLLGFNPAGWEAPQLHCGNDRVVTTDLLQISAGAGLSGDTLFTCILKGNWEKSPTANFTKWIIAGKNDRTAKKVSDDCDIPKRKMQDSAQSSKQLLLHLVSQITSFPLYLPNSDGILLLFLKLRVCRIPGFISVCWVLNWNHPYRFHKGFLLSSVRLKMSFSQCQRQMTRSSPSRSQWTGNPVPKTYCMI